MDVERSLYTFAGFLSDEERSARRQELERLLNAVVVKHEGVRTTCLQETAFIQHTVAAAVQLPHACSFCACSCMTTAVRLRISPRVACEEAAGCNTCRRPAVSAMPRAAF